VGGDLPPELQLKRAQAQVLQLADARGREDNRRGKRRGAQRPMLHDHNRSTNSQKRNS
jgi:hypothetical protein